MEQEQKIKYIQSKEFKKQLIGLRNRGGKYQKVSDEIRTILGSLDLEANPLSKLPITKNGESRIKHCIKYDLHDWCRLITIQNNGCCSFVYTGSHEECDKWLDNNRGLELTVDKTEVVPIYRSQDISIPEKRIKDGDDLSENRLLDRLGEWYIEFMSELVNGKIFRKIEHFSSEDEEDEIIGLCQEITDEEKQSLFFDVLVAAKSGKIDEAKNRIRLYKEELILIEKATKEEKEKLESNDSFIILDDFGRKELKTILDYSDWYDWMLFMHPAQRKVVETDFSGTSRLLGVSGSGKTCVVVNRALRLARKYTGEKILITTLNSALAKLITELVEVALAESPDAEEVRKAIEIKSFGELCRQLLLEFETDQIKKRSYDQYTDKHHDDFEQIWNEFYFCENNNHDADILLPVHKSLLSRGVYPQEYLKQEFDWIRSALGYDERSHYLDIQREGRSINFPKEFRRQVLEGLIGWEDKMVAVGVSDFLGLLKPLNEFVDIIEPRYRCILVDELQDFGTSELKIIRKLVPEEENDLFLCGDIAQQVYTKHHKISFAGIRIPPGSFLKIEKNYRNSREILEAASQVFMTNVSVESYKSDEFELIDPKYANFTSPKPFLRGTNTLNNEFNYSLQYLKKELSGSEKGCIAFCGYGFFDIKNIGTMLGLPVLDGDTDLKNGKIFLSDLEQTKGFEFDRMVIINCTNKVFPNPELPKEEWFREISKLYVAMTRAKKDLVISYHSNYSPVFESALQYFRETNWNDYLELSESELITLKKPRVWRDEEDIDPLTGKEFLYTHQALNFSLETLDKMESYIVHYRKRDHRKRKDSWLNIGELRHDIQRGKDIPNISRKLGPSVVNEIKQRLSIESYVSGLKL